MRRQVVLLALPLLGLAAPARASAAPAITVDTRGPALARGEGGRVTAALGFTNLADAPIELTAAPVDASDLGCRVTLAPARVPPAEHSDVTATIVPGCNVGQDGFDFVVSASEGTSSRGDFRITAAPKPSTSDPEWNALWAFPLVLGVLALVVLGYFLIALPGRTPVSQPLPYLEATWSFSDSWVSTVTVAGGLLTGVFGSTDVVTSLLGREADNAVALATVGAAAALALIGAGPIVLLATKSKSKHFFTVGGLLMASVVTLSGAFGEIWVVYRSGRQLDLGGWEDKIVVAAGLAAVLLAVYAARSLSATLRQGLDEPPRPAPSETMRAARLIVDALRTHPSVNELKVANALERHTEGMELTVVESLEPASPRRSALL